MHRKAVGGNDRLPGEHVHKKLRQQVLLLALHGGGHVILPIIARLLQAILQRLPAVRNFIHEVGPASRGTPIEITSAQPD